MSNQTAESAETPENPVPGVSADNSRILGLATLAFGLLLYYVFSSGLSLLWAQMKWANPRVLETFTRPQLLGGLIAVGGMVGVVANRRVRLYSNEVVAELRKVTWPTQAETWGTTKVSLALTGILALLLGAFDLVFAKLLTKLLGI